VKVSNFGNSISCEDERFEKTLLRELGKTFMGFIVKYKVITSSGRPGLQTAGSWESVVEDLYIVLVPFFPGICCWSPMEKCH